MNTNENSPSSSESKLGRKFVNRERELESLRHLFLIEGEPIAAITGGPGTGKTALAYNFREKFASKFPGGFFGMSLDPDDDPDYLAWEISEEIAQNRGLSLLIFDVSGPFKKPFNEYLDRVLAVNPNARILLESCQAIQSLPIGIQVNLENFTLDMTGEFISTFGVKLEPTMLQNLYLQALGNPRATAFLVEKLRAGNLSPNQLTQASPTFETSGLIDRYGLPLDSDTESYRTIITDVESVNDDLLHSLSNNPRLLYELTPRGFEKVVAELLHRLGYQITITRASKDGGKDIYAAKKNAIGSFLYLVECKKYAPDNRVGVELIRQLHGVVQAENATAGILVTTSFFTKGALEFQRKVSYQISLHDFLGIQKWLQSAVIDVA